jgi:hypothetical protein
VVGALGGGLAAWLLDPPRAMLAASGGYLLLLAALFLIGRREPSAARADGETAEQVAVAARR